MKRGENTRLEIISNTRRGIKANRKFDKPKPRLVRPRFYKHKCKNESNCNECSNYVNQLDQWRTKP